MEFALVVKVLRAKMEVKQEKKDDDRRTSRKRIRFSAASPANHGEGVSKAEDSGGFLSQTRANSDTFHSSISPLCSENKAVLSFCRLLCDAYDRLDDLGQPPSPTISGLMWRYKRDLETQSGPAS